jgi:nitrate reductase delta subunit
MTQSVQKTPSILKRSPEQLAALDRVREWTRARFALPEEATIIVAEVACGLPGCPPLETVVAFWFPGDMRHQFKVFKPVREVVEGDLPFAWLKEALVVFDGVGGDCC